MTKKTSAAITATRSINEEDFIEMAQGRYGINLIVTRKGQRIAIPVDIDTLQAIRECINTFSDVLARKERRQSYGHSIVGD